MNKIQKILIISFLLCVTLAQAQPDSIIYKNLQNPEKKTRFVDGFLDWFGQEEQQSELDTAGRKSANVVSRVLQRRLKGTFFRSYNFVDEVNWKTKKYRNHKRISADQELTVFGWHPYWMGNAYKGYNYQLLTTIAFFSYDVDPQSGSYRNTDAIYAWKNTELVELAHADSAKVLLTVTNHGYENNRQFLSADQTVKQALIDSLINFVELKGADGLDVNFELIPKKMRKKFNLFVSDLSNQLKSRNPEYILTLTVPSFDYKDVYDRKLLADVVDKFVIMGYDFHTPKSKAGPIAPLNQDLDSKRLDLRLSLNRHIKEGIPRHDLVMAVPYYGARWLLDGENSKFIDHMTYREIKQELLEKNITPTYDSTRHSMYFISTDSLGYKNLTWFDNENSLGAKYDWIIDEKVGGVGFWALGYDNGHMELWEQIDKKFTDFAVPKIKEKTAITFMNALRKHSNVVIVGIIFAILFFVVGFLIALTDWRVREAFFQANQFRLIYIGGVFFLMLTLFVIIGFLPLPWIVSILGLGLGLGLTVGISFLIKRWRAGLP